MRCQHRHQRRRRRDKNGFDRLYFKCCESELIYFVLCCRQTMTTLFEYYVKPEVTETR
jgi:hypothetical protein